MQLFGNRKKGRHTASGADTNRTEDHDNGDRLIKSDSGERVAKASPPPPGKKPKKKKNPWKIVGIVVLILALLAGGVYAYWHFTTKPPDVAAPSAAPDETSQPINITDTADREVGKYYTLLLVGKDAIGYNTDTIMIMRYDTVNMKANIYSIPRDTLVDVPYSVKKINSVYFQEKNGKQGGISALMDEIEDICGFRPDNYAVVDTSIVAKVIDTLGGVDFNVPVNMNYDDPQQDLHIHINKGQQHLNGENFVKVFRFRSTYAMGDIDRLNVQHDLIKAAAGQWITLGNIDKLFSAAKIMIQSAETNLSYGNMQWYAQEFMKMDASNISLATMPGDYSLEYRGGSYVGINVDEWLTAVNSELNPLKKTITKEDCKIAYKTEGGNFAVTDGSAFGASN